MRVSPNVAPVFISAFARSSSTPLYSNDEDASLFHGTPPLRGANNFPPSFQLSAMKAAATVSTEANGFSPPPLGRDTKGRRVQKREPTKRRGSGYNNNEVLLVTRARDRVAEMFNLFGSVGEEQAWLRRVSAENHRACQQLVDFAAAGAALLLAPAKREADATRERWQNKWVHVRG